MSIRNLKLKILQWEIQAGVKIIMRKHIDRRTNGVIGLSKHSRARFYGIPWGQPGQSLDSRVGKDLLGSQEARRRGILAERKPRHRKAEN